ncbi:hypothetical protein [Microcoleus vaginatus]
MKDTYLDVKAKIIGNKTVIIERQVLNAAAKESNRESKGVKLTGK